MPEPKKGSGCAGMKPAWNKAIKWVSEEEKVSGEEEKVSGTVDGFHGGRVKKRGRG